ncbi:UDP-3-O-(3-hydroxymyristoyl)glucosamine N-acyltransferase [Legionella erythra]|uniref:UDP-3-O-acylglucosamine N-acyltransferase n=1 Tax=Legionella erythra TaxID=448 RepID=A0A0W0TH98_LEGER|nr:UDP-3-O-(3-hydroxymyristoyl)glucosamine N-acyltransferase [Legionella erythra]KTC94597.1 UDP-3-O-[3-hydroxymyristoyl] glucosamine N-acyltransferase [Legionella erythra]
MKSLRFNQNHGPFSLAELAQVSGATLHNLKDSRFLIHHAAPLDEADRTDIAVLHNLKYIQAFKQARAGACIVFNDAVKHAPASMKLLIHPNPYKAFALVMQHFYSSSREEPAISPKAFIAASASIGPGCTIEHGAYIGDRAVIGEGSKIGVNSYIGHDVIIGKNCRIENNVSITNTLMGDNVVIYTGAKIGQEGFGFATDEAGHYSIPHVGSVIIGNHVEIGANTCVDRGSVKDTIIEDHCRIDNLVQIGHNVKIRRGSIIAGNTGIAGSSEIGEFAVLGGGVSVVNHAKIGPGAMVFAHALVIKDVAPGVKAGGTPAMEARQWHKQSLMLKKLCR